MANATDLIAGLNPVAAGLAASLLDQFPDVVFTSGRRTVDDQARAMAENTVLNRGWIAATYVSSPVSQACQAAVDQLTTPLTLPAVETTLVGVLAGFAADQLSQLSWHLSGDAFDVQPGSCDVESLRWLVVQKGGKLLTSEGGLVRWHIQVA